MYHIKNIGVEEIKRQQALRVRAKSLRFNQTVAERLLWQQLRSRKLGYKFRRQHPLFAYIVDFYCREANLIIEIDGKYHEAIGDKDRARDANLHRHGYNVLRFTNEQVLEDCANVVCIIQQNLNINLPPEREG